MTPNQALDARSPAAWRAYVHLRRLRLLGMEWRRERRAVASPQRRARNSADARQEPG